MSIYATEESRQYSGTLGFTLPARAAVVDTTTADATITADTATFTASDVGAQVTGPGIPANTTIESVTSATEAELSAPAIATDSDVTLSIVAARQFEKQVFTCELNPAVNSVGDELTMLNGNVLSSDEEVKWTLAIGAVQDFMDPAGFLEFCRTNALKAFPFTWEPNDELDAPTIAGDLTIRPGKYGGATKLRLTSDIEFPVLGDPTVTHPA